MLEILWTVVPILVVLVVFSYVVALVVVPFLTCSNCGQFDKEGFDESMWSAILNFGNMGAAFFQPLPRTRVCKECGFVLSSGVQSL